MTGTIVTIMYYPGVAAENAATVLTVTADANPDAINFVLPQSASVRVFGHVTLPANQTALQEAQRVQLQGGNQLTSPIAADGTFDFQHVRPAMTPSSVSTRPTWTPSRIRPTHRIARSPGRWSSASSAYP